MELDFMKKHSKKMSFCVPASTKLLLMTYVFTGQREPHGSIKSKCERGLHKGINIGRYDKLRAIDIQKHKNN